MMSEWVVHALAYLCIGACAGLMSGAIGIGGGIIVVPGLLTLFEQLNLIPEAYVMQVAAGCSLTAMIFSAASSVTTHMRVGTVLWDVFKKLWPGLLVGVVLGSILALLSNTQLLQEVFGLFLIAVAIKLFFDVHERPVLRLPNKCINYLICGSMGCLSGMLGVGGGVMIVPYLTFCGVNIRQISAVSSLCVLVVGSVGTLMFMITGTQTMENVSFSTGFIYWPAVIGVALSSSLMAPYGAKLSYKLPVSYLRNAFIFILLVTAVRMLSIEGS